METYGWFCIIVPTFNEEENVGRLIRSIYAQNYRPVEVIVVDGGSEDRTVEIVEMLRNRLSGPLFELNIILQREVSKLRNISDAYNLGIKSSKGEYILPLDADVVLTDENLLSKLSKALDKESVVRYKIRVIVDSWLEYNLMLDHRGIRLAQAYRWEFFKDFLFDTKLDTDHDTLTRLKGLLTDAKILDLEVGVHEPHTFKEYFVHKFWHGKIIWPLIRRHPKHILDLLVTSGPICLLFLALITFPISLISSIMILTPLCIVILYLYLKSQNKSLGRLTYILFRVTIGSLIRTIGVLKGLYDYSRGKLELGRSI